MATIGPLNLVCDNSSLANLQAWSAPIYDAFVTTCGWTQTADTGQAARLIAAVPSSAFVYWIFKASDALAATMPIVIKVEIGFSSTAPEFRVTIGTGSNGSGTITGLLTGSPWVLTSQNTNNGTTTFPCYFSGNSGNFRMYMWGGSTSLPAVALVIDRSKDATGADTNEHVTVLALNAFAAVAFQQTFTAAAQGPQFSGLIAGAPTQSTAFGGVPVPFEILPIIGKRGNPMWAMTVAQVDAADGSFPVVNSIYGANHTFLACCPSNRTNWSTNCGFRGVNGTAMGLLIRWE